MILTNIKKTLESYILKYGYKYKKYHCNYVNTNDLKQSLIYSTESIREVFKWTILD